MALISQYKRNESCNNHSANIVLLARMFGTPEEFDFAKRIVKARSKLGWLPSELDGIDVRTWQYGITTKYYSMLSRGGSNVK